MIDDIVEWRQCYTRMFVAPFAVLSNKLRNLSIIQVTKIVETQIQRGNPQLAPALSDFTGKPWICVIEGRIAKGKVAGARAPSPGPQSISCIRKSKERNSCTSDNVHG